MRLASLTVIFILSIFKPCDGIGQVIKKIDSTVPDNVNSINSIQGQLINSINGVVFEEYSQWVMPINYSWDDAVDVAIGNDNFIYTLTAEGGFSPSGYLLKSIEDSIIWTIKFQGNGNVYPRSIAVDSLSNIYVGMQVHGDIVLGKDTLSHVSSGDIVIAKVMPNGTVADARIFGGRFTDDVNSLIYHDKKIYMLGQYADTLSFNAHKLKSKGNFDFFIAKFDTALNISQVETFGGLGSDVAKDICIYKNSIYVVGTFNDKFHVGKDTVRTKGVRDIFIMSLNSNFQTLNWLVDEGGSEEDYVTSIKVNSQGIYIGGYYKDSTVFSGSKYSSNGAHDCFLVKYGLNGQLNSFTRFGGINDDRLLDMTLAKNGEVYSTGFVGKSSVDSIGVSSLPDTLYQSIFIAKHDTSLRSISAKFAVMPGVPQGNAIVAHDVNHCIYTAGTGHSGYFDGMLVLMGLFDGYLWKMPKF